MTDQLSQLANKYASDKGTIIPDDGRHHGPRLHFTPIYNKFMEPLKEQSLNLLEIGIGSGPSLKMWFDYFPNAQIHAIDIVNSAQFDNQRVKTHIANQQERNDLQNVINITGPLDIIVDDGGHMMGQQQVSFGFLFKHLKPGGLYFIEDLHTSYWPFGQFKDLYGFPLDINEKRTNTTVKMVEDYINNKKLKSEFLTKDECDYLNKNIASCELFDLPETMYGPNRLALFIKK